jgi:selenide, water dikinase
MNVNLERRKSVMARSIKLGHCVCNPRQSCPCDTFKERDLCPCAGEKAPPRKQRVALSQEVRKAGCASKISQADLKQILSQLPPVTDPNVVVGAAAGDDAGVYRLGDRYLLVQTVDVFTPCVDDPYLFGQIAAANSLSDIYAMGGRPLTALSVIGFPADELEGQIMTDILRGGVDKLREAGCSLVGGHSWQDEEIKCGFAITGLIEKQEVVIRDNAQPGDVLVLTKPLGTGMISFAAQLGRISPEALNEVGAVMATLNRDAAELMVRQRANAATDITGFGLMGHLVEMARNSRVEVELDMPALPVFAAAAECLEHEILPGAIERNQDYVGPFLRLECRAHPKNLPLLFDPQTSGGLLMSMPEAAARQVVEEMHRRGHAATNIVGRVMALPNGEKEGRVVVRDSRLTNWIGSSGAIAAAPPVATSKATVPISAPSPAATSEVACCAGMTPTSSPSLISETTPQQTGALTANDIQPVALPPDVPAAFRAFLKQANAGGVVDARAKKLMAIALSVATRCKSCLTSHLQTALAMSISRSEIDEAAWLGIAFGGSPAMVLYQEACRDLKL